MFGNDPEGATPLTADERQGLLADWVATRDDLNLAEQESIGAGLKAVNRGRARPLSQVLDDAFVRELHRRMFKDVWRWAGTYRASERNIGIDPHRVPTAVRDLVSLAALVAFARH